MMEEDCEGSLSSIVIKLLTSLIPSCDDAGVRSLYVASQHVPIGDELAGSIIVRCFVLK